MKITKGQQEERERRKQQKEYQRKKGKEQRKVDIPKRRWKKGHPQNQVCQMV